MRVGVKYTKKHKHGPRTSLCVGSEEKNNDFTVQQPRAESEQKTSGARTAAPSLHAWNWRTVKILERFIQLTKGIVALSFWKQTNKERGNGNHFTQVEVIHWESNLLQQHEAVNNIMEGWATSLGSYSTHHHIWWCCLDKTRPHHQIVPHSEYFWSHLDCEEWLNLL